MSEPHVLDMTTTRISDGDTIHISPEPQEEEVAAIIVALQAALNMSPDLDQPAPPGPRSRWKHAGRLQNITSSTRQNGVSGWASWQEDW
jgi:hypothetical protein